MGLTYFKRYRMVMDLAHFSDDHPSLPDDYDFLSWQESLLDDHAETKYRCFSLEIDANVFPCLGNRHGCQQLMREITRRDNFVPQATWLIERRSADGDSYCGTVQGLRDLEGRGAIQNLGVVPEHRGEGIGTALLIRALSGFRQAGIEIATLEVTAQNTGALRLYERFGFEVAKTVYKAAQVALV